MKKSFALMVAIAPSVLFGAIQATREYCDKNRDKAVSNAVSQLKTIAGPTIESYMAEHGIPTRVTNTVEQVINKEIVNSYHTNYIDNVISNYYEVKTVTNNFYEVTNTTYITTTTNYSTFVTAIQEETNTQFIVWSDDLLTIEKDGKQVWREKDVNDVNETVIKTYMDTKIDPVISDVETWMQSCDETWQGYIDGSNVVFAVNNYNPAATNQIYTTDVSVGKLTIRELDSNGKSYTTIYDSKKDIQSFLDKYKTEVKNSITDIDNRKADKAWGKYTSSGTDLDDMGMSNTVYMTAANTVFAGGTEWERVAVGEGAIWVLVDRGAPVYTDGEEGMFRFQDAGGTNYFGFAKTDSYNIGADTDGITQASGIVTLTYNITSSTKPIILYTSTLTKPIVWEQLNEADGSAVSGASHLVQWETNPAEGTQVCYINCADQPQGFFRAEIQVAGSASFITNMPADLQAGIIATNETTKSISVIKPVVRNGVVSWEVTK